VTNKILPLVAEGRRRKYYRLGRKGAWYGGIATADCVGCSLRCVFCWSDKPRDDPGQVGRFYEPGEVYGSLDRCARREGYRLLRVSGNEPAMARDHLLGLLELVDSERYRFILETNGIHIDEDFARRLSDFDCVHVRVSLKGANGDEFRVLTGAMPSAFEMQFYALRNLVSCGVSCHAAVMSSFSTRLGIDELKSKLERIHPALPKGLEEERLILYPHVRKRLKRAGIHPVRGMEE
jgi:uncharacterized Fe-S cluster-containing radical SAM superfamily protein